MNRLLLIFLVIILPGRCLSQTCLVYLKDKPAAGSPLLSPRSLARRTAGNIPLQVSDYPVDSVYLAKLALNGLKPEGVSRWLNAVLLSGTEQQFNEISKLPFVVSVIPINKPSSPGISEISGINSSSTSPLTSQIQLQQLGADRLHKAGYTGKGKLIAVFDNGFTGVDKQGPFRHLFTENKLLTSRNFVSPQKNVFEMGTDGDHGARVLSVLTAKLPPLFLGIAFDADFMLAVTEDMTQEGILEEWNWLLASEWADSAGADIISSSLGYATGFTYGTDHSYSDLDGHTTLIAQAANLAASKGILVVNSAGNEGESSWRHLISPADADSCLAVGAVDENEKYGSFSSTGPTSDGRIKPDVMAMGVLTTTFLPQGFLKTGNGTSFACPLISGLAACLWQADSTLTNMQLFKMLKESGNHAADPDTFYGWGIPNAVKLLLNLKHEELPVREQMDNYLRVFPNPAIDYATFSYFNYGPPRVITFRLFDATGSEKLKLDFPADHGYCETRLNLKALNLNKGLYFLSVSEDDTQIFPENRLMIMD